MILTISSKHFLKRQLVGPCIGNGPLTFEVELNFEARPQNCENRLLASCCLPVRLSIRMKNSAPTERVFMKF